MVGTTVAEYQKRKNPYLNKFAKKGINTPISSLTTVTPETFRGGPGPDLRWMSNAEANRGQPKVDRTNFNTPPTGGNTALGNAGGTGISPSPLLKPIDTPGFQAMYTGNSRNKPAFGRLGAIDQITELANMSMQQKIAERNARINAANRRTQQYNQYSSGPSTFPSGGGNPGNTGLDDEQLTNARIIADIGRRRGLDDNAIQIAIMTALTESSLRNVNYGDTAGPDSRGLFQQRPSQGWGSFAQVQDPRYAANKFYDELTKMGYSGRTPWQAAQAVQRSAFSDGSNYQKNWALAQRAYAGLSSNNITNLPYQVDTKGLLKGPQFDAARFIAQNNNKYIDYDGAYGAQCVDLYNLYTARFVGGTNYMVGWAPEIFNNYDRKTYTRIAPQQRGMMGYVAVFNRGGATPYGHVAIVVGDNGNGTLRLLSANATPQGSRGNTTIHNISKATLMGYLAPNKLIGR